MNSDSRSLTWITKEGYFDPAQFPMDCVLKQAVSDHENEFRSAVSMLSLMYTHGRKEAGVFLLGLLLNCEDAWEKRTMIVEALGVMETKACADLLIGELRRVKGSNTTRKYLTAILRVLVRMPSELVLDGLADLADDPSFTHRMRAKFRAVLEEAAQSDGDYF